MVEIKCANASCGKTHNRRFFFCPNCGYQLIGMYPDFQHPDMLVFSAKAGGWTKAYVVSVGGKLLTQVQEPRLSAAGINLKDQSGQEHTSDLLTLYGEISKDGFDVLTI